MAVAADTVDVLGVHVTHAGKVLWPQDGITKLELARYFERIAPTAMPYVQDRPLTLRPFPRGVERPGFYLKNAPRGAPAWIRTFRDVAESTGKPVDFVVASEPRTLVWLAQYNAVELHPWLSRVDDPDHPDWAVIDLDPHAGGEWEQLAAAAITIREELDRVGLRAFPKLSGQSGLHVLVPLAREHSFDEVRAFIGELAREACRRRPDLLTDEYTVRARGGRILADYAQNARAKNTVAPYSVRPKRGAPVAVPLTWDELEGPDLRGRWTLRNIFERLDAVGDPLAPALTLEQRLPSSAARHAR